MTARTIGPFQLDKQLGAGGMGVVYRATYTKTGQQVALKVLSPAMTANKSVVARFEREIEILKRLKHPNIARYLGGGKVGNQHFYVMELMTGGSLEGLLKEKGRLPWEQVIDYGVQICQALEHAHHAGIVHRDLKPANLFLTADGKLKLGDFGIARDTEATALTAAGKTVGTYAYMAPEQISGKPPVSGKTDLYALGCVLYQMLTGRTPHQAGDPGEMLFKHMQEEPDRVTAHAVDCPVWLESVVMRLLEKSPEDRFYDALATQVALEDVGTKVAAHASMARQQTVLMTGTGTKTQGDAAELQKLLGKKKKKKSKRVPIYERAWFLAACLLVLASGVAWAVWPDSEAELYAKGEALMQEANSLPQNQDNATRRATLLASARDDYFNKLLQRFPEGQYTERTKEYLDEIATDVAERQAEMLIRLPTREPKNEGERLYVEARKFEEFGDRITALERYRSMVEVLSGRDEFKPYVALARRRIAQVEATGEGEVDRIEVVNGALQRADEQWSRGKKLEADKIWRSIINLYATNQEFEPQVKYARARLAGQEVDPFDYEAPPENETEIDAR